MVAPALRLEGYSDLVLLEHELPALDLEMDGEMLSLVFPDGKTLPLSADGFTSLCQLIRVPVGFAKRLWKDHRGHVLAYLQKQLGKAYQRDEPVFVFCKKDECVLSLANKEQVLRDRNAVLGVDKVVREAAGDKLVRIEEHWNKIEYFFSLKKEVLDEDPDKASWELGCVLSLSLIGLRSPMFYWVATRGDDVSCSVLPFKPVEMLVNNALLGDIVSHLQSMHAEGWTDLRGYVQRMTAVKASLQEVKEARTKLKKLKVDKEDNETSERIEKHFDWKKIAETYDLKSMQPKPSKKWFMSAAAPYSLFHVHNTLVSEATHSPKDTPEEVLQKIHKLATKLMRKVPDLAEKQPPVIFK